VGVDRFWTTQQWKEKGDEKKIKRVPKKLKRERREGGGEKVQKLDGCRVSFFALFLPSPSSSLLCSHLISFPLLSWCFEKVQDLVHTHTHTK
jgi:hypothetical protein